MERKRTELPRDLEEMIGDPIVRLVMASDGVDVHELRKVCSLARQRLGLSTPARRAA